MVIDQIRKDRQADIASAAQILVELDADTARGLLADAGLKITDRDHVLRVLATESFPAFKAAQRILAAYED